MPAETLHFCRFEELQAYCGCRGARFQETKAVPVCGFEIRGTLSKVGKTLPTVQCRSLSAIVKTVCKAGRLTKPVFFLRQVCGFRWLMVVPLTSRP